MTTELERQLRAGMERVEARDPSGLAVRAYRRYRRRRRTIRALAATGTAVAVAGMATALASARATSSQETQASAGVGSRVGGALAQVSGDMLYTRTTYTPPGSTGRKWNLTIVWSYHQRIRSTEYALAGRPYWDTGITMVAGPWSIRAVNVDYPARTVMRITPGGDQGGLTVPAGGPVAPPPAYCSVDMPPTTGGILLQAGASPAAWAKYFKAVLACGQFRVAGQQRLGGTDTIKLVDVPSRQRGYRPE